MKRFLVLIIFCSTMFFLPATLIADSISIVADVWCPYNCTPNSAEPGYGIEIAKKVFEAAGHTIDYKNVPWARAIQESRKGKYNAIIGAYKEDAPDFVFPDEEFGISKNVFFTKKGNTWKYKDMNSLKNVKIGLIKDYSYGEGFDKFFKSNPKIVQFVSGDDALNLNIKKLMKGRIDVLVEDPNVFMLAAKKMNIIDQVAKAGNTGPGDNLYIAFSPKIAKSKEYAAQLSEGIKKLKESGELEKILAKYGLEYWK